MRDYRKTPLLDCVRIPNTMMTAVRNTTRVTLKLINPRFFEQVTAVEFAKIFRQYLAFTLNNMSDSGELKRICKISI